MRKIESFNVDHIRLEKGVFVSRIDRVGSETLTTFDLRMKKANAELLEPSAVHTLEHLIATFVRNDDEFGSKIVYFGPMGCLTGMYLIVHGEYTSSQILPLIVRAFEFAANFNDDIPGVSEIECGSYRLHDLSGAKNEAVNYLEVLKSAKHENLNYPQ